MEEITNLKEMTEGQATVKFIDVKIDDTRIYLKTTSNIYTVNLERESKIGMETLILDDTINLYDDWRKLEFNLIKNHVCLFSDFILNYTTLLLLHGRILSVFDTVRH